VRTNIVKRLAFVLCALASVAATAIGQAPSPRTAARMPGGLLEQLSESLQQLACKVSPAVVEIQVTAFGPAQPGDGKAAVIVRQHGVGAGVIVDPDGYIVTNAHVVDRAQRIRVMLSPSTTSCNTSSTLIRAAEATVVGSDKLTDLALLKIEASHLPTLAFSRDRAPRSGQLVFAIGSPNGLQNTVTMGVISSPFRQPDPDSPMAYLQTDAPINPGNSGGPLVDITGAIVGLNTFIMTNSGGSEGLGFAIPAPVVEFVYESLKKYGHVNHVDIGVMAQTVTADLTSGLGLVQDWGVVIADVMPSGPADKAGMKPGDIVVAVGGHTVLGLSAFAAALYQHPSNQPLQLDVQRGTEKLSFHVPPHISSEPVDTFRGFTDLATSHIERLGIFGLDLADAPSPIRSDMRSERGVVVVGNGRGFDAAETGLEPGDVISSLNRSSIESVAQLRDAVALLKRGAAVVLRIERSGRFQFLTFQME
jgi:serine protease Do